MSRSTPSTAVVVPNRRIRPWVVMAEADPVVGGVAGSTYLTVFDILISILYTDGQSNERHPRTPHAGASAAAAQVFAERGFHGATLDAVASAAGFSKGAVYSNFKNKEDLFLALLEASYS